MDFEEFLKLLSDNHRLLIVGGGVICFIGLFLPFFQINVEFSYSSITMGSDESLFSTWLFWIFLIVIGGMYYGYYQGYGEKYTYIFLAIGGLLCLLTLYGTQIHTGGDNLISILYGFYVEFLGSLAVTIGGYYYYLENTSKNQ